VAFNLNQEERSIVCFAEDWGRHPSTAQFLIQKLIPYYKVLWINSLGLRRPRLNIGDLSRILTKLKERKEGKARLQGNLIVYTPLVIPIHNIRPFRAFNKFILKKEILHLMENHNIKNPNLIIACPSAENMIGELGERKSIYYCADEYSVFPGLSKKLVKKLDESILRKVDVVAVTSQNLLESKRVFNQHIHLIPHGVDFTHFAKTMDPDTEIADGIKRIPKPIIGYYGLIQNLIDFEIIGFMAKARPNWSFVLIGARIFDAKDIPAEKNIYFLGQKPYESLPNYLKAFDICMIPYKINERTLNANPVKLREYLASGKPVISTPLPEVLKYSKYVEVAENGQEFIKSIGELLKQNNPTYQKERMDSVRTSDWTYIVKKLEALF
jgi:glycosyltransferase involved in cell wall biosynthesis